MRSLIQHQFDPFDDRKLLKQTKKMAIQFLLIISLRQAYDPG